MTHAALRWNRRASDQIWSIAGPVRAGDALSITSARMAHICAGRLKKWQAFKIVHVGRQEIDSKFF